MQNRSPAVVKMAIRGQLVNVRPVSASLLHNTGLFAQKDPICEVSMHKQIFRTSPCWSKGSRPMWKESFTLTRTGETEITFTVLNRSKIGIRHVVGKGTFRFTEQPATNIEAHIQLANRGAVAGELLVMISLIGAVDGGLYPGLQQGPSFIILKQQPIEDDSSCKQRCKRQLSFRDIVIVPEGFYPPQAFGSLRMINES